MTTTFSDALTAAAAAEYRANIPKRRDRPRRDPPGDVERYLLREHIAEALVDVPRDALAASVALYYGDDATAYDMLACVVAAVREAARSMNELRRATGGEPQ